jgi:hypothetical protein
MRAIFISYRRDDAEGQAGRLFDDLAAHFGPDSVFMDVAAIEPGRDFRRVIDEHVTSCGVLLAVIGKGWVNSVDDSGQRRLDDPLDFVRLETAAALKRDIPVVPVLVHGAKMPRADQLPSDLAELTFRNGVELTHARWDSDVQLLLKALQPYVKANQDRVIEISPTPVKSWSKFIVAALAVIALAAAGYVWRKEHFQVTQNSPKTEGLTESEKPTLAQSDADKEAKRKAEATRIANEKLAADQRARDLAAKQKIEYDRLAKLKVETEKQARELAATEKAEADRIANEKLAAEQRAREVAAKEKAESEKIANEKLAAEQRAREDAAVRSAWKSASFPPPNAGAVLITFVNGNPGCASYDAASCLWGLTYDQIDFPRIKPLICGDGHRAKYGMTGYEDPKHWCSLAKKQYALTNAIRRNIAITTQPK